MDLKSLLSKLSTQIQHTKPDIKLTKQVLLSTKYPVTKIVL
jgi:hypothetical protein